jgi:hypothetical protein
MILVNPFTHQVLNTWSDEARRASLEARRRKLKGTQVVDRSGDPLRVFHGTDSAKDFDLSEFRDDLAIPSSEGIYFTADPEEAGIYAGIKPKARIYPAYLNLKKPKIVPPDKFGNFRRGSLAKEGYDGAISSDLKQFLALRADQIERGIG